MPNWSDENGRFWWVPPGAPYYEQVEIPHPPFPQKGCNCACCNHSRKKFKSMHRLTIESTTGTVYGRCSCGLSFTNINEDEVRKAHIKHLQFNAKTKGK